MLPGLLWMRIAISTLVLLGGTTSAAHGESPTEKLYRAYYLEREKGDEVGAAKLYAEVAAARGVGADVQSVAKARLAGCQEELAASDLARLMPPGPLAYAELNRPGERVRELLNQLGLLAHANEPPVPGQNRLAISPDLVDALLGVRGAALAITGLDPTRQRPAGVMVLHPGDMEVVRGLIETGLPAGATVLPPIGGFPAYEIESIYVTLTARLVLVGSSPAEIEGVLDRLRDPQAESLATDPQLADVLKDRHGELLFFCVNPQPLLPLLDLLGPAGASQNRQVALAQALLDPKSLRALTGRMDLGDQGLSLELTLRLAEGHRNLVYNFFRRPAIDMQTLRCVPAGAAAFVALAMNAAPPEYAEASSANTGALPVVTALDIGREIFANINGIAVYALPPSGTGAVPGGIPDLAATITVNDPAKSQALWAEILGLVSLATGGPTIEGEPAEIGGTPVRSYGMHHKMTVYEATLGHHLFIASTEAALARALETKRSGQSVVDDPGLAPLIARLGANTTFALLINAGRSAQLARSFLPPEQAAQLEPAIALLANTTALVTIDQSDRVLRLSGGITGVPNVSGLVNKMLTEQHERQVAGREVAQAIREKNWDHALGLVDRKLSKEAGNADALRQKFDILAVQKEDTPAARAAGDQLAEALQDDARGLNNLAWVLLTEPRYSGRFNELALRLARRSNELTGSKSWAYVDTLALAEFEAGDVARAVELEQKAIDLSKQTAGGSGIAEMQQALQRFQAAQEEKEAAADRAD
jgi:tetratricopeptide (TPR) repeat protein